MTEKLHILYADHAKSLGATMRAVAFDHRDTITIDVAIFMEDVRALWKEADPDYYRAYVHYGLERCGEMTLTETWELFGEMILRLGANFVLTATSPGHVSEFKQLCSDVHTMDPITAFYEVCALAGESEE